jgi:hypothetical protein
MPKPDWEAIATIQRQTDWVTRQAAIKIAELGGADAVSGFLSNSVCNLIAIASVEQGKERAIELMVHGFQTAEAFVEDQLTG